jgi:carnitine O-palmitoyltransferase 1
MLVFANGKAIVHAEHSWGDAPVIAHMWEWILSGDIQDNNYGKDGYIDPAKMIRYPNHGKFKGSAPERLQWALLPSTVEVIHKALEQATGKAPPADTRSPLFANYIHFFLYQTL